MPTLIDECLMRRGQFLCTMNHCFDKTLLVAQIGVTLKVKLKARVRRFTIFEAWNDFFSGYENVGSMSESDQLHTYPSPDPTLTLTCYFLIVVELGGRAGRFRISQILTLT